MSTKSSFTASLQRELQRLVSRPIYFISSVVIMSFCFLFFLTFFDEGQPNKMPIAVVDLDNSALSRQYIRNLNSTQQAEVVEHLYSHKAAREEMQKGNIYAFVVIGHNFASQALSNRRPSICFYVNDAYLIAGSLLFKDISYVTALTSAGMQRQVLRARGMEESRIMGIIQPIKMETHLIGNPWANYGTYLLNVILPGMLQLMVLLMTIFAIGTEFKDRSSHSWLESANNSIFTALTAKLLPQTIVYTILGIIGNILLYSYMRFPMHSSIGWMFLSTFLFVLATQSIGIFIIGITPVLRDGITIAGFFGVMGVSFAGPTFPIEQMPKAIRIFSDLFPIRHYFKIYVNQALHGTSVTHSLIWFAVLLSFTALPFFVLHRLKIAAMSQSYPIV